MKYKFNKNSSPLKYILTFFLIATSTSYNNVFCSGGIRGWLMKFAEPSPSPFPSLSLSGEAKVSYIETRTSITVKNNEASGEIIKSLNKQCEHLANQVLVEKDSILKLKFAEAAQKCNELRTGFQQSLNQMGTSSSTGSVSGSGEASSGGVLAGSPQSPSLSYINDFYFFRTCDSSILLGGILSYFFLIVMILQLYIFLNLCKSLLIKDYIFSYVGVLKKISFGFWEFFLLFFVGIFYIFLFYFMVMYDLNLETTQVAISDNAYKNQIHRFLTKTTMYYVKTSLGLPADPPCADGGCFD